MAGDTTKSEVSDGDPDGVSVRSCFTVLFEDPFWVGLYEREDDGKYEVCKVIFGAEPKDYDVFDYLLRNARRLKFSPPVAAARREDRKINPKRMRREIEKQTENKGIGTKAQQALQLLREQNKREKQVGARARREEEEERKFALRQEKKKEKHRGR